MRSSGETGVTVDTADRYASTTAVASATTADALPSDGDGSGNRPGALELPAGLPPKPYAEKLRPPFSFCITDDRTASVAAYGLDTSRPPSPSVCRLLGDDGVIDSLAFAFLIVTIEQQSPHPNHTLGRFRLTTTADPRAAAWGQLPGATAQTLANLELQRGGLELRRIQPAGADVLVALDGELRRLADRPTEHVDACALFGRHLGIAYQIYDDLVDLLQDDTKAGKTLGTDAASGKLTLPMLLERDRSGKGFLTALRAGGDARRLISADAWRECFRRLDAEIAAAEQALEPVAGSPSPFFLLRLTAFLREAAARLAPKA